MFSAGADLYALAETEILIPAGKTVFVSTGIAMEIPEGYVERISAIVTNKVKFSRIIQTTNFFTELREVRDSLLAPQVEETMAE